MDETRLLLAAYERFGDLAVACKQLIEGALPQRSRATRVAVAKALRVRLVRWNPPAWVVDELAFMARQDDHTDFKAALLLHLSRQDALLYDFVEDALVPAWLSGQTIITRADANRFMDAAAVEHPEIERWSASTCEKLAGNALTILRDCGLLAGSTRGSAPKRIVEPAVSPLAVRHLVRLLRAEGVPLDNIAGHRDWRLWLWDERRAAAAVAAVTEEVKP